MSQKAVGVKDVGVQGVSFKGFKDVGKRSLKDCLNVNVSCNLTRLLYVNPVNFCHCLLITMCIHMGFKISFDKLSLHTVFIAFGISSVFFLQGLYCNFSRNIYGMENL